MATLRTDAALPVWELAELWARDSGHSPIDTVRLLAGAIIYQGLLTNSKEAATLDLDSGALAFRGDPFVGYRATPESPLMVLRSTALRHLVAVARDGAAPRRGSLAQEFIQKSDFRTWLTVNGRALPAFWFGPAA